MPRTKSIKQAQLQSNSFLKLHRLKNPVHEIDRENAISVAKNIHVVDNKEVRENPYFNRDKESKDYVINLTKKELYSIGQLSEQGW